MMYYDISVVEVNINGLSNLSVHTASGLCIHKSDGRRLRIESNRYLGSNKGPL